jgi:hypothetical protein
VIILGITAVFSTILWYKNFENDELLFKNLALVSWAATIMFFIDKIYASILEGEEFINISAESIALGFLLLFIVLTIWMASVIWVDPRRVFKRKF